MKKKVLKTLFCLTLTASMLLGETGAVLAANTAGVEAAENIVFEDDTKARKIVSATGTLADVTGLAYDAATGVLSWNKVANADGYKVEQYNADGTLKSDEPTGQLYMNLKEYFSSVNDTPYIFKVTAYNNSEYAVAATDVAGIYLTKYNEAIGKMVSGIYAADQTTLLYEEGVAYDEAIEKTVKNADGTESHYYTLYKGYTPSANPAAVTLILSTDTSKSVSPLTGLNLKEQSETSITYEAAANLQAGEYIAYAYANNPAYKSDAKKGMYSNKGTCYNEEGYSGVTAESITINYSNFSAGDTVYLKVWVYNPNYNYSAVAGQTMDNRKSAELAVTFAVPAAKMEAVDVTATANSIRLKPVASGSVTAYEYQRKEGKKWITLAKQFDNFTDTGLKADVEYNYRVRAYSKNKLTGKTTATAWKTVKATTWGSTLNVQASAASAKAVKLTWNKIAGVDGYEIYRKDTISESFNYKKDIGQEFFSTAKLVKDIKKAKTTKYTDKKLAKGESYQYVIRAYRTIGKTKTYIDASASIDLSAEGMSVNTSYYDKNGAYVVEWNKMTGISGYKVEKRNPATGNYELYKTLKKGATSVKLPKVAVGGKDETYRIRPYKGSMVYNGTVEYTVNPKLAAVKNVKAVQTAEGVNVTWSPVAGADYYRVYRARKDSYYYDETAKAYSLGDYTTPIREVNCEDTSAGLSFAPTKVNQGTNTEYAKVIVAPTDIQYDEEDSKYVVDAAGNKHSVYYDYDEDEYYYTDFNTIVSQQAYTSYEYDGLNSALMNWYGEFSNPYTLYGIVDDEDDPEGTKIKGTSVVDKTVAVTSLIPKSDDENYNEAADPEYNAKYDSYYGSYGRFQKNADGTLKTELKTLVEGPQVGTDYFYFVEAVAEPSNGANRNYTVTTSAGYTKSAKVSYTDIAAGKATKIKSAKSSKKETVALKFKKVSGVKGYAVYRSNKKNGTYTQIGTNTKPNYTDKSVTGGKTYFYKVATIKESENGTYIYSNLSSAKKVKAKK